MKYEFRNTVANHYTDITEDCENPCPAHEIHIVFDHENNGHIDGTVLCNASKAEICGVAMSVLEALDVTVKEMIMMQMLNDFTDNVLGDTAEDACDDEKDGDE